jgi:beta-lactamase family protein
MRVIRNLKSAAVVAILLVGLAAVVLAQRQPLAQESACQSLTPAAVGGPMPKDPNVAVVRWLGHANYELAYRDTVILADAYYDRPPRNHPVGVMPKDFKRADAILIGHAHFDHISDAAQVAKQTGATVVGASFGNDTLHLGGLADKQIKTVQGGEALEFKNVFVQTVLAHHNVIATTVPAGYLEKVATTMAAASLDTPLTEAEQKEAAAIQARGSRDPGIADKGTIGYLLTLGNNFRVMVLDSPGPITEGERKMMQSIPGGVDVAFLSLVSMDAGIPPLVELVKLFKPGTMFLGHMDGPGTMHWASLFPAALAIRDVVPKTRMLEVPYRTPVCFNTATKEMFVGQ